MEPFNSIFALGGDQSSLAPRRRAVLGNVVDTRVSALLCARLCHELSGPVAGVNNGTELLVDEDLDFAHDAVELIGVSALFPLNRTYAIAVEGAYHWINVYSPRPRYVTLGAGLRISF